MQYLQRLSLNFSVLDTHQSLLFLRDKTKVKPSFIATVLLIVILTIIFLIDGIGILTAISCFLIPAFNCLEEYARKLSLTDQQSSRIIQEEQITFKQKYIIYFMCYLAMQILTPLLNGIPWMLLRILFMIAMLHPKISILQYAKDFLCKKTLLVDNADKKDK